MPDDATREGHAGRPRRSSVRPHPPVGSPGGDGLGLGGIGHGVPDACSCAAAEWRRGLAVAGIGLVVLGAAAWVTAFVVPFTDP
jgi:hypothetical protein